jgi:Ferritin-like
MAHRKPAKIKTLRELHQHLQTAIELEHATIPAYLTALYSIKEATNTDASLVIRSVVVEEMLHLTLASNVMNAVGGQPSLNHREFVPHYPTPLPHSALRFQVNLEKFSPEAIETFKRIEHPAYGPAPKPEPDQYHSIGQFYEAILEGIDTLVRQLGHSAVFRGQLSRQVTPEQYYGSGGRLIVVTDQESAHAAIDEIIDQGEGSADGKLVWEEKRKHKLGYRDQAAHFYRFDEIQKGCYYKEGDKPDHPNGPELCVNYDEVWPATANSRAVEYVPGSPQRRTLDGFNRAYKNFLNVLHAAFNGDPGLIADSIPIMYDLKYKAQAVMCVPVQNRVDGNNRPTETLGPSWEWVPD